MPPGIGYGKAAQERTAAADAFAEARKAVSAGPVAMTDRGDGPGRRRPVRTQRAGAKLKKRVRRA